MEHGTSRRSVLAAALLVSGTLPKLSMATTKQPLKILVGYSAGGGTDLLARALAQQIAPMLGRPVVIENRPGAGGRIAAEALKNSPADGSVVMLAPNGLTTIQSIVYKSELRYDPSRDFAPVAKVAVSEHAIAVGNDLNVSNARELAAWLKANPNRANFGSPAAGGLPHFTGLLLAQAVGTPMNHVPYKGGGPAALAVASGEIPIGIGSIEDFIKLEEGGKLKIIGSFGEQRSVLTPQISTISEQGFLVKAPGWNAMWAKIGTADSHIQEISTAVQKALQQPALQDRLKAMLFVPSYASSAELMQLQRQEWAQWEPIISASGFKPGE